MYLNHNGVEKEKKKMNRYKHCICMYCKMIKLNLTVTIHQ